MREIKFRGKRVDNDEWVYGDLFRVFGEAFIQHKKNIEYYDVDKINSNTVGQYTGLKDIEGTPVYEGDILEWFSPKADTDGSDLRYKVTVIWNGCGFDVENYENGLIDFLECKGNETVKVIGNIHD